MSQWESLISQVFCLKGLAEIYVPFVGSTEAAESLPARVGVLGPMLVGLRPSGEFADKDGHGWIAQSCA
jgi:hypothetical protein